MRVLRWPSFWLVAIHVVTATFYTSVEKATWVDGFWWVTHATAIPATAQPGTKVYSIFVFAIVFALQIWFAERFLVLLFSGEGKFLWRHINDVKASEMSDHYIVCGYGQVGRTLTDHLVKDGQPLVVIESDPQGYAELVQANIPSIQGNARQKDILIRAGIERAKAMCIVIDNEADNLFVIITARSLNPKIYIVSRAGHTGYLEVMHQAGADEVVVPEYEGGLRVIRTLERFTLVKR